MCLLLLAATLPVALPACAAGAPGAARAERERLLGIFRAGEAGAPAALTAALDHESAFVRRTAAHLLVRSGPSALPGIEKALASPDFQVRRTAIRGLLEMDRLGPWLEIVENDEHHSIREEFRNTISLEFTARRSRSFLAGRAVPLFDGREGYARADGPLAAGEGDFTLEAWILPEEMESRIQGVAGYGRGDGPERPGLALRFHEGGIIFFQVANRLGRVSVSHAVGTTGQWFHAAVSVEREGRARLFINGLEVASEGAGPIRGDDGQDTGVFRVGCRAHQPAMWQFRGSIIEVRFWRRARGGEEIGRDMFRRLSGEEDGLALYWPMDEGEGEILRDHSPARVDGRLVNTAWRLEEVPARSKPGRE